MTDEETWGSSDEVNGGIAEILEATRPWVKTMSIFGFVMVGFMVLGGLLMGIAGAVVGEASMVLMTVVYGLMGLLYLYPALYLFRFASRINEFLAERTQATLAAALEQQRVFWKYVTIVVLISTAASFVLVLAVGMFGAFMGMR